MGFRYSRVVLLTLALAPGLRGGEAEHPPILDPSLTRCEVCHAAVLEGGVTHPAADDCQACHRFSKADGRSTVSFVAEGSSLCVACHAEMERGASAAFAASHAPVTDDCLGCHEAHGSRHEALLRESEPALCFGCHDSGWLREAHGVSLARARCAGCHPPHGSDQPGMLVEGDQHAPFASRSCEACHRRGLATRERSGVSSTCFACHDASAFRGEAVHSVVSRGQCLSCHDPHVSVQSNLLVRAKDGLCLECHSGIGEKLEGATVHAAAPDACDTCHVPHASAHRDLLVDGTSALCATCHDLDDPAVRARHLGAGMASLDCSECHDAHGSSLDVLVADRSVHPPFLDGCGTCHVGATTTLVADGERQLCLACHGEIAAAVSDAPHPHAAIEMAECGECHTPHASRHRSLVRSARGAVCFPCHDALEAASGERPHGAITLEGCEACHEPHGGSRPRLLRAEADELCLSCHDGAVRPEKPASPAGTGPVDGAPAPVPSIRLRDGAFDHPLPGHRTLGTPTAEELAALRTPVRHTGEIHCVTCHDPHKGATAGLFAGGRSEVCGSCHAN